MRKFNNKLVHFSQTPQKIREALSIKRLGGVCLMNFCASGETLLGEDIIPVIKAILEEGHYLMLVTNATLKMRFDEIAAFDVKLLKKLFFKFSFHYLELLRLNLIDTFFDNIKKMERVGCSFTVELTPYDELVPHINEIKKVCLENLGTLPHVTIARDNRTKSRNHLSSLYDFETYKKIWGIFDSELFNFKKKIFYQKRREFCYAGDWSAFIDLSSGVMRQCYCGKILEEDIYRDTNAPLKFEAIGHKCKIAKHAHCYNGHAFLTLGVIPEFTAPTFDTMRNRVRLDGKQWLQPEMQEIMSQKLKDNNKEYPFFKKLITDINMISIKTIKNTILIAKKRLLFAQKTKSIL
jgi:hypothetical protein